MGRVLLKLSHSRGLVPILTVDNNDNGSPPFLTAAVSFQHIPSLSERLPKPFPRMASTRREPTQFALTSLFQTHILGLTQSML